MDFGWLLVDEGMVFTKPYEFLDVVVLALPIFGVFHNSQDCFCVSILSVRVFKMLLTVEVLGSRTMNTESDSLACQNLSLFSAESICLFHL